MTKAHIGRWRRYAAYYRGARLALTVSIGLAALQSLLLVPVAGLVKVALERVVPSHDLSSLFVCGAAILGLQVASVAASLAARHLSLRVTKQAVARLRLDVFDHVLSWSADFHSRSDSGTLHSVLVQDTERVDIMSNAIVTQMIPALLLGACLAVYLAWLDAWLLVATLSLVPVALVTNRTAGARLRLRVTAFQRDFEAFSRMTLHQIQRLALTRLQTAEAVERVQRVNDVERLRESSRRMAWLASAYTQMQSLIGALAGVLILVIGGRGVIDGTLTLGALASFYVGAVMLASQASAAVALVPQIIAGDRSLVALCGLLDVRAPQPYRGTARIEFSGRVVLAGVNFSYGDRPLLTNVSFSIEPHRTMAVVGPNGAGKSTIAKLVLGLYRPAAGSLFADEVPYDNVDLWHLRQSMSVVPQDGWLLTGSIRENIAYGRPDMPEADVEDAAERASVRAFIESLPHGYDTQVGERGVRLSGGQRQRIAIARALARRPSLLILDEPTTYLDAAAVQHVLSGFSELPGSPAVLLITHDPVLTRIVDSVYRLDALATVSAALRR